MNLFETLANVKIPVTIMVTSLQEYLQVMKLFDLLGISWINGNSGIKPLDIFYWGFHSQDQIFIEIFNDEGSYAIRISSPRRVQAFRNFLPKLNLPGKIRKELADFMDSINIIETTPRGFKFLSGNIYLLFPTKPRRTYAIDAESMYFSRKDIDEGMSYAFTRKEFHELMSFGDSSMPEHFIVVNRKQDFMYETFFMSDSECCANSLTHYTEFHNVRVVGLGDPFYFNVRKSGLCFINDFPYYFFFLGSDALLFAKIDSEGLINGLFPFALFKE